MPPRQPRDLALTLGFPPALQACAIAQVAGTPVVVPRAGSVTALPLCATQLVEALAWAARAGADVTAVVLVGGRVATPHPGALRALPSSRRAPGQLRVLGLPSDQRVRPLTTALQHAMLLMRPRTEATWRALDALDRHRGNAAAAARELGCSPQAVRQHRARGHYEALLGLPDLVDALLTRPPSE